MEAFILALIDETKERLKAEMALQAIQPSPGLLESIKRLQVKIEHLEHSLALARGYAKTR